MATLRYTCPGNDTQAGFLGRKGSSGNRKLLKTLEREARDLRARGDWGEKAVEVNTRILVLDPNNKTALNRRAKCRREQKDFLAAEADYRRSLVLDPDNAHVQNALTEIQEQVRKQRAGREFIEEIHTIESFSKAYAIARTHKDKSPAKRLIAVEALKRAFLLDRERIDVLIELAAVHRTLRQRDEAEKIYEWILRREANSAAKVGLAAVYKDRKRLKDSLKLCEEVLAQEPRNPYALRCRAGILSELDRRAEAAESFQKSIGSSEL